MVIYKFGNAIQMQIGAIVERSAADGSWPVSRLADAWIGR